MPAATTLSASMSRPESVSSSIAIFGLTSRSWSISCRFFSPPEKPSLRFRWANAWSMDRSFIAPFISLRKSRSLGASPRTAVAAVRRKLDTVTPGTSTGYCMARNRPALARASTLIASTFSPSSETDPLVPWYFGWPAMEYASVDLPEPFGPMIAWVCPAATVRLTPRKISRLSPPCPVTLTCRSRISRVDISLLFGNGHVYVAVFYSHLVGGQRFGSWRAGRLARAQVKARTVQPALDRVVVDLAVD